MFQNVFSKLFHLDIGDQDYGKIERDILHSLSYLDSRRSVWPATNVTGIGNVLCLVC